MLLVEDEEAVLEFERDVLVGAGAEVTTSMSVEDTQQRLRNGSFDVIVMNGRMPGGCSAREMYEWIATKLSWSGERAAADVLHCDRRRRLEVSSTSMACLRWRSRLKWPT